jgi:hypothetical protein
MPGRALQWSVWGGCSCAGSVARNPRLAVFLRACECFFVMGGAVKSENACEKTQPEKSVGQAANLAGASGVKGLLRS